MKVGIITLPLYVNYGGILQTYALQTILKRMGHEVVVFQKKKKSLYKLPLWKYPFSYAKRIIYKCLVDHRFPIMLERKQRIESPILRQHLIEFITTNINVQTIERISEIDKYDIDAIIVGSDQIWRKEYVRRGWNANIQDVYLRFISNKKTLKISYAASFGVDEWMYSKKETADCQQLIKDFFAVSVREMSAVSLCSKYLNIKATLVLDPTMLLTKKDYISLFSNQNGNNSGRTLFCYLLDKTQDKLSLMETIAKERDFTRTVLMNVDMQDYVTSLSQRVILPVEDWLKGFFEADFVLTDSFHGCVFSIIMGKPFVAIANSKRGCSRFISLLKMFDMENHLIFSKDDYQSGESYDLSELTEKTLCDYRVKSMSFLQNSLNNSPA